MKELFIHLIKSYQIISKPFLPHVCRFYPTCSNYAIDAIHQLGICRGSIKILFRLFRCNPLNKGGYDPVK